MSSYIGGVALSNEQYLIGSTLFGTCNTSASATNKQIILSSFDQLLNGVTVHIKFSLGNTVESGATLQFYASSADITNNNPIINLAPVNVTGSFICAINSVIAFTYEDDGSNKYWRVNNSIDIEESTNNGNITVNGQDIPIHGLGTAAYTSSTDYAESNHTHSEYAPINNPTFTGIVTMPAVNDNSADTTAATVGYIKFRTAGLSNLTGAMHFKGTVNEIPPASGTYESGDVVILTGTHKEYVCVSDGSNASWIELGDEGSFLLQSAVAEGTATYIGTNDFTPNILPTLTVDHTGVSQVTTTESSVTTTQYTIPKVTQAGTAMTAAVANGILTLTPGTNTVLDNNDITIHGFNESKNLTIPSVSVSTVYLDAQVHFTQGSAASLNKTDVTVIVPNNSQEGE